MRIIIAILASFALATSAGAQIAWKDFPTARQEAVETGKLLLLHFYSDDCVFCEKLEAGAYQNPAVIAAIHDKFVPVKIYGPTNQKPVELLGITGYPTDVVLLPTGDKFGQELLKMFSPQDPQGYVSMLKQAETNRDTLLARQTPKPQMVPQASQTVTTPTINVPAARFLQASSPRRREAVARQPAINQPAINQPLVNQPVVEQPVVEQPVASRPTPDQQVINPPVPSLRLQSDDPMMEGYCLVTMVDEERWELGSPRIGAMHLGRLYLFASTLAREKFLALPEKYAPVMSGMDVVLFFDEGRVVPGARDFGSTIENMQCMFFFSSEASLRRFEMAEQHRPSYSIKAIELTKQAAAEANR